MVAFFVNLFETCLAPHDGETEHWGVDQIYLNVAGIVKAYGQHL